jgi:hypothetical protein
LIISLFSTSIPEDILPDVSPKREFIFYSTVAVTSFSCHVILFGFISTFERPISALFYLLAPIFFFIFMGFLFLILKLFQFKDAA